MDLSSFYAGKLLAHNLLLFMHSTQLTDFYPSLLQYITVQWTLIVCLVLKTVELRKHGPCLETSW